MRFSVWQELGRKSRSRWSLFCLVGLVVILPQGWISAWAWEQNVRGLYLILISFFCSSLIVPFSIVLALRYHVLDVPDDRKVHKAVTPRLGGLAVYGATVLTLLRNDQWSQPLVFLVLAGTVVFVMGVREDARGLSARVRLTGQIAAALLAAGGGVCARLSVVPAGHALEIALTVFWLVGITNAINFLDGIDGLAGGVGALCAALFLAIAWPERQKHLAYGASALAGACLGFLPYNWQPARLFLGDAGATFIGFMLAGLGILGTETHQQLPFVALSTPLLILAIPVFDMIYTTLSRVRRGAVRSVKEWLEFTGKDHFHHRLMHLGMTAPGAVKFILLVNLCFGLSAIANRNTLSRFVSATLLAQAFVIFGVIVVLMLLGRELTSDKTPAKTADAEGEVVTGR